MVKGVFRFIFRQNLVIKRWGALKQTVGQIGIYVTFINTLMLAVTLYSTGWVQENVIDINFWGFMAVVFGIIGLLLLMAWKMDLPSYFTSWNEQWWKHDNPMKEYLDKKFNSIDQRFSDLEKQDEDNKRTP